MTYESFEVASVIVYTVDGGRFFVGFENKWYYTTNLGRTANYEDPITAKILTKIENVETKIDNAVAELKNYMRGVKSTIIDRIDRI